MHNPAFFAYGLKTRTSTRPTTEINSALATSTPLTISAILLSSRNKAVIVNAMQSDIQNLQRQCRRCQDVYLRKKIFSKSLRSAREALSLIVSMTWSHPHVCAPSTQSRKKKRQAVKKGGRKWLSQVETEAERVERGLYV